MANTYTQLYVHVIFAVKSRANLIAEPWNEALYKYITGIVTNKNQKLMVINGMPDHVHILLGYSSDCMLSDLVRDIKANSSKWINENNFRPGKFEWQTGFGAFTVSQSQIKTVVNYILKQAKHHKRQSFRTEYINFLNAYRIDFEPEYLFEDLGAAPLGLDNTTRALFYSINLSPAGALNHATCDLFY